MKVNFDLLSKYLMVIGAVFLLDSHFRIFGLALIGYAVWRGFSKNIFNRNKELRAFENLIITLRQRFFKYKMTINRSLKYKVFVCPNCSQKLKVPRKRGKVTITCSKCGTKFKAKS